MPTYVVSLAELPEAYRLVGEKLPRAALIKAMQAGALRTERIAVKKSPVDLGRYRDSWRVDLLEDGAELVNDAPHAAVIEFGRRPGQRPPPLLAILEWAQRHAHDIILNSTGRAIAATKSGRRKATTRFSDDENRNLMRFARALQMKIARDGMPPHFVMRESVNSGLPLVGAEINREMSAIRVK